MSDLAGSIDRPRVLGVLAHPDDECIFGWPVFQNSHLDKTLIMLVSDRDNPERPWCARRVEALEEVCRRNHIRMTCLHFDSEFYRLPYRRADRVLSHIYDAVGRQIAAEVRDFKPDFVFCHNPHGEYGMFDHRIVFDIVYHHSAAENVVITDLCEIHPGWPSFDRIPPRELRLYYHGRPNLSVQLDPEFYRTCKGIYDELRCWTWKQTLPPDYPPPRCRLYWLDSGNSGLAGKFQRLGIDFSDGARELET